MTDDVELTRLVREGDEHAVEELYQRHHRALLSYAARVCGIPGTAEDLASEAFVRTLRTVRSGTGGPSGAWRPYLYAVVRNTATAWAQSDRRLVLTPEFTDLPDEAEDDSNADTALAVQAYESLPERWKTVLWHTIIEDESPEQVGRILGITANAVNVLAFRAREGLRRAFLSVHLTTVTEPECHAFADRMAGAVRKPGNRRPRALEAHLTSCRACSRAHAELLDINAALRAAMPLALLLPAAAKAAPLGAAPAAGAAAEGVGIGVRGKVLAAAGGLTIASALAVAVAIWPAPDRTPPAPPRAGPTAPEGGTTPTARQPELLPKSASPRPIQGIRINYAPLRSCVGSEGGTVVALPCDDPRTAWRQDGDDHFKLVNKLTGTCLTAGERYDPESFGEGIRSVRTGPCPDGDTWSTPIFSDGVTRLVHDPTRTALSIGETFDSPAPTAFILYRAYDDSAEQRFALT